MTTRVMSGFAPYARTGAICARWRNVRALCLGSMMACPPHPSPWTISHTQAPPPATCHFCSIDSRASRRFADFLLDSEFEELRVALLYGRCVKNEEGRLGVQAKISSHPIPPHPISSHPIPPHIIPPHPISTHSTPPHPPPSHLIASHLISSFPIPPLFISSPLHPIPPLPTSPFTIKPPPPHSAHSLLARLHSSSLVTALPLPSLAHTICPGRLPEPLFSSHSHFHCCRCRSFCCCCCCCCCCCSYYSYSYYYYY